MKCRMQAGQMFFGGGMWGAKRTVWGLVSPEIQTWWFCTGHATCPLRNGLKAPRFLTGGTAGALRAGAVDIDMK